LASSRNLLLIPPLFLIVCDWALTLWFQSNKYWNGGYEHFREAHPVGQLLVGSHPLAFTVGIFFWMLIIWLILHMLPLRGAVIVSLAITMGHAYGASTWVGNLLPGGPVASGMVFLFASALFVFVYERLKKAAMPVMETSSAFKRMARVSFSLLLIFALLVGFAPYRGKIPVAGRRACSYAAA
jgi:hypothetical protein